MASTTTFGPVTVNPGSRTFGPVPLADTDVLIDLTVDRTITNGFNSQPNTVAARISFEQSDDSGSTWLELCAATFVGGVYTMHGGLPVNSNDVGTMLRPGTNRQGRAIVTISGGPVAVQGSLIIS